MAGSFSSDNPTTTTLTRTTINGLRSSAILVFTAHRFYVSTTGIFGSGLTNGITPDSSIHSGPLAISRYCTGLFCWNAPFKDVSDSARFLCRQPVRPEVPLEGRLLLAVRRSGGRGRSRCG
jgi:hypothetical protein